MTEFSDEMYEADCRAYILVEGLRDITHGRFKIGDRVRKISGSSWRGRIVGFYSTNITPNGYCVESENEPGAVQIYPEKALEFVE